LRPLIIIALLLFVACNGDKNSTEKILGDTLQTNLKTVSVDTTPTSKNIWLDKLTNNKYNLPDTIAGKPAIFYLDNPKVAPIAKLLYYEKFRPGDNDSTTQLLKLVTTDDEEIRPFYRWCLDLTIQISDGALAEYPGEPALKYAIKFPQEFFIYMDKDATGQRYKEWTEIIAYSGLSDYTKHSSQIQNEIIIKMTNNCAACDSDMKKRIISLQKTLLMILNYKIDFYGSQSIATSVADTLQHQGSFAFI